MQLYDAWKRVAYDTKGQPVKRVWDEYLDLEKEVYKLLIRGKITHVEGTTAEVGKRFNLSPTYMAAFVDGIRECVDGLPELESLDENSYINLNIEWDRLYKQMVEYKADDLYTLPEWKTIFSAEEQKQLYTEQKRSHTIVRNEAKIGRNEPCPCGSGKKYKKCCGAVVSA